MFDNPNKELRRLQEQLLAAEDAPPKKKAEAPPASKPKSEPAENDRNAMTEEEARRRKLVGLTLMLTSELLILAIIIWLWLQWR